MPVQLPREDDTSHTHALQIEYKKDVRSRNSDLIDLMQSFALRRQFIIDRSPLIGDLIKKFNFCRSLNKYDNIVTSHKVCACLCV